MSNHSFTLKSGVVLQVTTAPFEDAVALVEAIKKLTFGLDPSLEITDVVIFDPQVRKALYAVFPLALYGPTRVSPGLFDDPKEGDRARGDYFEICSHLITVNSKPFFLNPPSASTTSDPPATKSPEPPSP